jgi:FkbM family methyltransferase
MTLLGSLSRRLGRLSPSLDTRLSWMSLRRADLALRVVDELVHSGDLVVDVGAAEGFYAARLSQLVGRSGHVHAFEPNPVYFPQLEELSNRRSNLTTYALGLSDRQGQAQLHVPVLDNEHLYGLGSLSVPARRADIEHLEVSIRLERLDAVLASETRPVAFLKCDVEGHELAALRGGKETLRRSPPRMLIEIEQRHQDANIEATFAYLEEFGYVGYSLQPDGLQPLKEFSVERDQLAFLSPSFQEIPSPEYVHNFLFVPPATDVTRLLAA